MFQALSPSVAALGLNPVRVRGVLPSFWFSEFPNNQLTFHDLCGSEWVDDEVRRYAAVAAKAATDVRKFLDNPALSHDDRWGIYLAAQALTVESDQYMNPRLGRPGTPITSMLHCIGRLESDLDTANKRGWLPDLGAGRRIILGQMYGWRVSLSGVYHLLFRGCGSRPSIGWLSARERLNGLALIDGMTTNASRERLCALWNTHGGVSTEFDRAWETTTVGVRYWRGRFAAKDAPALMPPHGREVVEDYLRGWGIVTPIEQLFELLDAEACNAANEAARIGCNLLPNPVPESDEAIAQQAELVKQHFVALLHEHGLNDHGLNDIKINVLSAGQSHGETLATTSAGGRTIDVCSASNAVAWQDNGVFLNCLIAHELTHCLQMRQSVVPKGYASGMACEGTAEAAEDWWMMHVEPKRGVLHRLLVREQRLAVSTACCWRFHMGLMSEDALVAAHLETGVSEERAQRTVAGIMGSVSGRPMYWLGKRLVAAGQRGRGLSIAATFPYLARETGLILPGHAIIPDVNPLHFDLAHYDGLSHRVRLACTLFP